ncbi:MAG: hypothetical protein ACPGVX_05955 [Thalassobaculaceae bacterium]
MSSDLTATPRRPAQRDLRQEICWAPADTAGYLRLAKHLMPAKAVRLSRKLAARILMLAPTHPQGLALAAHFGHNGDMRADYQAFIRWALAVPGHPLVYGAFARLLRRTTLVNKTHRIGRWAFLSTPLDHELYSLVGRQLLQSKNHALVVRYVIKAMVLAPEQAEPHITLAESTIEKAPLTVAGTAARRLQIVTADAACGFAEAVIRDPRPAIFIHIPKTAGTAALRATAPYATPLGHRWIETAPTPRERSYAAWVHPNLPLSPEFLRERTVFSNIRHILPFLVSFYRHARRGFAAPEMIPVVARAREYAFADFLRVIAGHDTPWVSRRFLFPALFDRASGALLTDWINRSESLAEDLQAMCRRHGFRYHPVSTANENAGGAPWQSYYDAALIDLVWDTWRREIAVFGFERDGGYRADAPLYRDVGALKTRFRYDWRSDQLTGGGD